MSPTASEPIVRSTASDSVEWGERLVELAEPDEREADVRDLDDHLAQIADLAAHLRALAQNVGHARVVAAAVRTHADGAAEDVHHLSVVREPLGGHPLEPR